MRNGMSKASYYGGAEGQQETLSYLEFGSLDLENATKKIWGYWQDQEAYDLYMFARYARDLFLFRDYFEEEEKNFNNLNECIKNSAHDKIVDYIFKYAGIMTLIHNDQCTQSLCESGSSLFGFIEEVMALDYVIHDGANIDKMKQLTYLGSDISEMMNRGVQTLHPDIKFQFSTADTISKLMDEWHSIGMFYGLSVSLRYALRTAADVIKVALNSDIVTFNRISLSYNGNEQVKAGTGKYAYVMSIPELKELLAANNIVAKYTTENMQQNKDGERTVRVSLVLSKSPDIVEQFIREYNSCISKMMDSNVITYQTGCWKDFSEL